MEKNVNNLYTDYPKAIICTNDAAMDWLLNRTQEIEEKLCPFYYRTQGEDKIKKHFMSIQTTKMCHINATAILQQYQSQEWLDFFYSGTYL
jgi:hypothetical protein